MARQSPRMSALATMTRCGGMAKDATGETPPPLTSGSLFIVFDLFITC